MGEFYYISIYVLTEMVNYVLAYRILMNAKLSRVKWRVSLGIFLIVLCHFAIWQALSIQDSMALSPITMFLIPLLFLSGARKEYVYMYPFMICLSSVVGVVYSFGISLFMKIPIGVVIHGNGYTVICQIVQSAVMLVWYGIYILIKKEHYPISFHIMQYVLYDFVACIGMAGVAALQGMCDVELYSPYATAAGLFVSTGVGAMLLITLWSGILAQRRRIAEEKYKYSESLANMQRHYYENLLQRDEDLRRFKHDVRAYIIAMKSYVLQKQYDDLLAYLERVEVFSLDNTFNRYTGNSVADTVIGTFMEESKKRKIPLKVEGKLAENRYFEPVDVCIILYNLLENAFEACEMIEEANDRWINICVGELNSHWLIEITNTTNAMPVIANNVIDTTKEDSIHHGFGTKNIKRTVEKYGGSLKYTVEDGIFKAEVLL